MNATLEISLFGTCLVRLAGDPVVELRSTKHKALVAMLASAPLGRRTRAHLQNTLWGYAGYDSGHQNLRRALSDMRKTFGPSFDTLFHTTNNDVELDLDHVSFVGDPSQGHFLDDLNIYEANYRSWVNEVRADPGRIGAICSSKTPKVLGRSKPRVAVLPLAVMDNDPNLRILADWVSEEVSRSLSRSNLLTVISHLSSREIATNLIDIGQVRRVLGVDYVMTGTLRTHGSELVADFDFTDANSGDILWNRNLTSPASSFAHDMPDRLTNVIQSIGRSIATAAISYVRDRPLPQIKDHQLVMAGVSLMHRSPMRDFLSSREYLIEARDRMPNAAETHAWLGKWYVLSVFKGFSTDRMGDTQKALDCTARALDLDPENSFGLTIDGFARSNLLKHMDEAEERYNAALNVNPNESLSWLLRGALMAFQDDGAAAIRATETARRLSPIDPFGYYYDSLASTAYIAAEDYKLALDRAERSLSVNDRHLSTLRTRTTALYFLGRGEEARASAQDLMRRHPNFSIEEYKSNHPSAGNKAGQRVIEALTGSGII